MKKVEPTNKEEDREKDYQYARGQLYNIIDKMQRHWMVPWMLLREWPPPCFRSCIPGRPNICRCSDKLQDLQKKQKEITKEDAPTGDVTRNRQQCLHDQDYCRPHEDAERAQQDDK